MPDDDGMPFVTRLTTLRSRFLSKLDHHTAEVVRGASTALVLRVFGAMLTFILNLVIARFYGATGSGVYFLAFTVMTIAVVFGRMGMDNALLRFAAARAETGDWEQVKGVYRLGLSTAIIASLVSTLVMALAAPILARVVFHDVAITSSLVWMSLAVLPVVLSTLLSQLLRARLRIAAAMLVATAWIPGLATLGLLFAGRGGGELTAVQIYVGAAGITALAAWWWFHHVTPQFRGVKGQFEARILFNSSVPLLWVAALTTSLNWLPNFALGSTHTTAEVGIFNAASRVSFLVSFVLIAVDTISAPKFAALYEMGDQVALASTARNSARLMVFVAFPLLLICLVLSGQIMGLFGPEFRRGGPVLAVLAVAQAVSVFAGSVGSLLMMSGHERQVRNSNAIAAAVCLVISALSVPAAGAIGAAAAVGTALVVRNAYEIMMVRRYLGIRVTALSGWRE
jgi:O-antigen/teichoic acid export membrane protein